MSDEEKKLCKDIENMLNSLENKVDWAIEIRKLIENLTKENKNIIIQRLFNLEDVFREICQILNKTLFYVKRNQNEKKYKEIELNKPLITKIEIKEENEKPNKIIEKEKINVNSIIEKKDEIKDLENKKNDKNEKKNFFKKNPLNPLIIDDNNNSNNGNEIKQENKKGVKINIPSNNNKTQLNFEYNHSKKEINEIYGNKIITNENNNNKNINKNFGSIKVDRNFTSYNFENERYNIKPNVNSEKEKKEKEKLEKEKLEKEKREKLEKEKKEKEKLEKEKLEKEKREKLEKEKREKEKLKKEKLEKEKMKKEKLKNTKIEKEKKSLKEIKNTEDISKEINISEPEETSLNNLIIQSNNERNEYSINPIELAEQIKNREDKIYQLISILNKREDLRDMLSGYYERDIIELLNSPELDTDIIESMFSTIDEIEKLKLRDNDIYEEEDEESHSI